MKSIAVIVVNYQTAELSVQAIKSVLAHDSKTWQVEIHLVDNASNQADVELLEGALGSETSVTLWMESINHGFGRGNNVVLEELSKRETPPSYVFLLNPDAYLMNDTVTHLADFLEHTPQAGAAGARCYDGDGALVSGAFRFPGALSELEKTVNFGPVTRALKTYRVPMREDLGEEPVDWVSGAAVMFRFDALQEVGFFDPGFFLYYEEVDLMRRLHSAGWKVYHCPKAIICHLEGASTQVEQLPRRPAYLYRSWRRYFSKSGRLYALVVSAALWIGSVTGILVAFLMRRSSQVPKRFFRDHWNYVVAPLLGLRSDPNYDGEKT